MLTSTRFSRRGFLAAAGATAAPLVVPASVFGSADTAPNSRIALGMIGVGRMGHLHARLLAERDDVQVLAVCDVEEGRRQAAKQAIEQQYARRSGARRVALYNDFRDLLARKDVDAVVISTPEHWHAIQAIEAVKAGKDVYGEKPMSLTVREGRAMVDAVRRYGRVFQTGSMQRSATEFRVACELVRAGRIGKLQRIMVNVGKTSADCYLPGEPVPKGLDWDMWLGPAPWRPFNAIICPPSNFPDWPQWRRYRDYSGGQIADWGAHHFDIAQWGMGADGTGPVEVLLPNEDYAGPTFCYASGVMLHANAKKNPGPACTFFGTDGRIGVNRGTLSVEPKDLMPRGAAVTNRWTYPEHHTNWLHAIRTRQKPICDVEVGHRSISVSHIGNIALWLNRPLKWDPAKEEFVGDAEANRWLDRPKREPWTL
jgi:predicted dehydrogenase